METEKENIISNFINSIVGKMLRGGEKKKIELKYSELPKKLSKEEAINLIQELGYEVEDNVEGKMLVIIKTYKDNSKVEAENDFVGLLKDIREYNYSFFFTEVLDISRIPLPADTIVELIEIFDFQWNFRDANTIEVMDRPDFEREV